jgi:short-subunit dehydrogenase
MEFSERYGPWAVVAGGSEGVGACFARRAAERGLNLILTGRKAEPLEAVATSIRASLPGRQVRILPGDLCEANCRTELKAFSSDVDVGLFIYNAGAASRTGPFLDDDVEFAQRLVALNIIGKVDLTHHFGGLMKTRGRGGIILVGSLAGIGGTPGIAIYSSVKSFSMSFAEALWFELRPHGVDVLGFQLTATNTPAMARHYPAMANVGAEPDEVALQGLDSLADGPTRFAGDGAAWALSMSRMSRLDALEARAAASAGYQSKASVP